MYQAFINLPEDIEEAITNLIAQDTDLQASSEILHQQYLKREKRHSEGYIHNFSGALAYLAFRFPATYAQITASLLSVEEVIPSWKPKTLLDIGSGPGTGVLAIHNVWPDLLSATCVDIRSDLQDLGKSIVGNNELATEVVWKTEDIRKGFLEQSSYDIVLLGNVLNELSEHDVEKVLNTAYQMCKGVLLVVEPGTAYGNALIQSVAKKFSNEYLIAPYVANSFVTNDDYWIHFSQRFTRPEFQRRIRQRMRESSEMAADWEDTKYCYVAISKIPSEVTAWGRCIGLVTKQKGFLTIPVLTQEGIIHVKVMKRHKKQYSFAKDLKWGEQIIHEEDIVV